MSKDLIISELQLFLDDKIHVLMAELALVQMEHRDTATITEYVIVITSK